MKMLVAYWNNPNKHPNAQDNVYGQHEQSESLVVQKVTLHLERMAVGTHSRSVPAIGLVTQSTVDFIYFVLKAESHFIYPNRITNSLYSRQ